eukprot:gene5418-7347_t
MHIKQRIHVSDEMVSFVGKGAVPAHGWPADAIGLSFDGATLAFHGHPASAAMSEGDLAFVVTAGACRRIFGFIPDADARWHLPAQLRALTIAILDCRLPGEARDTLRLAKSIELLCATFTAFAADTLIPADDTGDLNEADARRRTLARKTHARFDRARLRPKPRQADPWFPRHVRHHRRRGDR